MGDIVKQYDSKIPSEQSSRSDIATFLYFSIIFFHNYYRVE